MAERKPKQNVYRQSVGGLLGSHQAQVAVYRPKVLLVRDVMALSYRVLSETFGMVGMAQLEGIRSAMVQDIAEWQGPMSNWRESANRLKGESLHADLI